MSLSFIVSGFVVGILVGLTGVGGGSLMTPLLTLVFGIPPAVAVGTDLAFASITKTAGTFTHKFRGTVKWRIVGLLCFGALPSAIVATICLHYFGTHFGAFNKEFGQVIRYTIVGSVLMTVVALLFRDQMQAWAINHPEKQFHGRRLDAVTMIAGVILGAMVTVSSIGAGTIGATLLVILYPRLTAAEIAGTDIAYAVPLTAFAAMGHWWLGSINVDLLFTLLIGSIPGIILGSLAAHVVPERILRGLLASILTVVAAKLLFS